jgi:hypothetical protein
LNPLVKPRHISFLPLLFLFPLIPLSGQPRIFERPGNQPVAEELMLPSSTRELINLTGRWMYSLDGEDWGEVSVPASFDHEGTIIFQRKFSIDKGAIESSHYKIVALGINNEAEILINDVFVGKHVGGYTSFELDVPDGVLQFGSENTIRIISNNRLTATSTVPVSKQVWGWRNYGGILREVFLVATPRIWINRLTVQTNYMAEKQQGEIQCAVTISNDGAADLLDSLSAAAKAPIGFTIQFELTDSQTGEVVGLSQPVPFDLRINQDTEVRSLLTVNTPKSWSPETPELYRLKSSLLVLEQKKRKVIDEESRLVGFRDLRVVGDRLRLNGKHITLRGVVWHEDSPTTGASLSYEEMERDVALIKTLGANAIRFAFHPPHPYMIALCSRYGILATEELPIWNVPAPVLMREQFQEIAETIARDMVARDQHHPSVIAWGIGSEFESSDLRARSYVQRLANTLKTLDGRPVFFGSLLLQNERCADLVDFVAIVPSQADLKSFKLSLANWKKLHPAKPLIILRYGKPVEHNNRNGYSDPLSQEAQARFYIQHHEAIRQAGAAGSFINAFADWRGDRPLLSLHSADSYVYPLGLVSQGREKRMAFDVVKTVYADQKVGALPAGSYRSSLPVAHVVAGLSVIFVLAYHYNYNRRFREALKRSLLRPYNFFADLRDLRAASLLHTLVLTGAIALTLSVVVSGFLYFIRGSAHGDAWSTLIIPSDTLRERVAFVAWNLTEGIGILTALFFAVSLAVTIAIKIAALAARVRVTWMHAFSVTAWSASPFIFLSPLGMSLFKVLESNLYLAACSTIVGLFGVWVMVRMLRGISVLFDVGAGKTYAIGLLIIIALILSVFLYLDGRYSLFDSGTFLINIARYSA